MGESKLFGEFWADGYPWGWSGLRFLEGVSVEGDVGPRFQIGWEIGGGVRVPGGLGVCVWLWLKRKGKGVGCWFYRNMKRRHQMAFLQWLKRDVFEWGGGEIVCCLV